ncbi:MAG: diaminopimelate epimerase [Acidobacteriota bacterium]
MPASCSKLHGAGNDFLLFDGSEREELADLLPPLVERLCHRRLGLGADGVLLLDPLPESRARLVYWNADGSRAVFCANGTRCAARFVAARWGWPAVTLLTDHAEILAEVGGSEVTLHLPPPALVEPWRELAVEAQVIRARYLIVGVPHLVVPVDWPDFWRRPLAPLAPALRAHPALPAGGANVSFVQVAQGELAVRSWERGVEGETLSCGSGDVAAALVALAEGWASGRVSVLTASSRRLLVTPEAVAPICPVRLTGPAEWVGDISVAPELLAGPPASASAVGSPGAPPADPLSTVDRGRIPDE